MSGYHPGYHPFGLEWKIDISYPGIQIYLNADISLLTTGQEHQIATSRAESKMLVRVVVLLSK